MIFSFEEQLQSGFIFQGLLFSRDAINNINVRLSICLLERVLGGVKIHMTTDNLSVGLCLIYIESSLVAHFFLIYIEILYYL